MNNLWSCGQWIILFQQYDDYCSVTPEFERSIFPVISLYLRTASVISPKYVRIGPTNLLDQRETHMPARRVDQSAKPDQSIYSASCRSFGTKECDCQGKIAVS